MIRDVLFPDMDVFEGVLPSEHFSTNWGSTSRVFEEMVETYHPSTIFEIGTWEGYSAIHMARICDRLGLECEIVCIDTFAGCAEHWTQAKWKHMLDIGPDGRPRLYERFLSNVKAAGMERFITPCPLPSITAAALMKGIGAKADLVYLDGDHQFQNVRMELEVFWPLCTKAMFGHDLADPGVRAAVDDLRETILLRPDFWIRSRYDNPES